MDVFSLGHVLYEIWSGQNPWQDTGGKRIKSMVMEGSLPINLNKLEEWEGQQLHTKRGDFHAANEEVDGGEYDEYSKLDQAFGRVIRECYWVDPKRRITAEGLVVKLTQLLTSAREMLEDKSTGNA